MRDEDEFLRVKGITGEAEVFGTVEPVVNEKEDMIDFGLVENEKAVQYIDHEIEEIVDASAALESYGQLLRASKWDGISKQTAKAMAIGLGRIDRVVGDKSSLVASLEDETSGDIKRIGNAPAATGIGAIVGRAKEILVKLLEKIKEKFTKLKTIAQAKWQQFKEQYEARLEEIEESMNNYSPNGANGGLKINISGKVAALAYPGGKYEDFSKFPALHRWIATTGLQWIKTELANLAKLDASTPANEIGKDVDSPFTHDLPDSMEWTVRGINWKTEGSDPVEIPVRDATAISRTLDAIRKSQAEATNTSGALDEIANVMIGLPTLSRSISTEDEAKAALVQGIIFSINSFAEKLFKLRVMLNDIVGAALDIIEAEQKVSFQSSNEEFYYGFEDDGEEPAAQPGKLKAMAQKLMAWLQEMWGKLIAKWEQITKAHAVVEQKVEAAKEDLKAKASESGSSDEKAPDQSTPENILVNCTADMATRIFNGKELIEPSAFLPVFKYAFSELGAYYMPIVNDLRKAYRAGDLEGLQKIAEAGINPPGYDQVLPNGAKLVVNDGAIEIQQEPGEAFEYEAGDFKTVIRILDEAKKLSAAREGESGHNLQALSSILNRFRGELTTDMTKGGNHMELIQAAQNITRPLTKSLLAAATLHNELSRYPLEYLAIGIL